MCFSGSGPQTTASAIASSLALSAASSKYFGSASSESNDQGSAAGGHHSRAICRASFSVLAQHMGFTDSIRSELIHDGSNVWITVVNLPALNTPQFEWSRSRMPRQPQPVSPIFQPEVAADAILWAARHRRRELDVGFSTIRAVVVQKLVPGFADHYLAAMGYDSQQTSEPADPNRPDNLFTPVHGQFAAHGQFDSRARVMSLRFSIKKRRTPAL